MPYLTQADLCKRHRELHTKWKAHVDTVYELIGGNPRWWEMYYRGLRLNGVDPAQMAFGLHPLCDGVGPCPFLESVR